jgi:alpha-D-ribose 1-methylphosphonate 5-triphosphate synthase subunit PhnH
MTTAPSLDPAFASQSFASQSAFRAAMECFARPGEVRSLEGVAAPAPLAPATASLIQSLADYETPVWLDGCFTAGAEAGAWIRFHTGAPLVSEPGLAAFALIADSRRIPSLAQFAQGTAEYPDRSATLLIQVECFGGNQFDIAGPGIKGIAGFAAEPLPDDFADRLAENHALFPRGVDIVLIAGDRIVALPRSARVTRRA